MGLYTKHAFTDIHNQVTVIRKRLLTSNRSKIPSLKIAELRNKLMILWKEDSWKCSNWKRAQPVFNAFMLNDIVFLFTAWN